MRTIFADGFEESGFFDYEGIKELTVPVGWKPDWVDLPEHIPSILHRPEYSPKDTHAGAAEAEQVHSGRFAACIANVFSTQNACLYTTIKEGVKKGDHVRLRAWAMSIVRDKDDPNKFGGHGMRVGIDPAGGTKFDGLNVRYGLWYGSDEPEYRRGEWVEIFVDAVAEADQISIFLHTFCKVAYQTNASHWDDVVVEVGDADEFDPPFQPLKPEYIETDTEVFKLTLEKLDDLIQLRIKQAMNG
jgi:hypothetical protein